MQPEKTNKTPNANTISMERREVCATCAGVEGGGYEDCEIATVMLGPDLFGGEPDDIFCPFWDGERGRAEGIACVVCGKSLPEDEVIWAHKDGSLSTDTGEPYCAACLPSQPEDDERCPHGHSKDDACLDCAAEASNALVEDDGWNDPTRHNADCLCEVCLLYRKEQGWDCLYCGETFGDGEQKLDVEQDGVTFKVHLACWNAHTDDADEIVLPDLDYEENRDQALDFLVAAQGGVDIDTARLLAAIHNKLYDEWAEPVTHKTVYDQFIVAPEESPAAPASAGRPALPTVIDGADADDWLHLTRDGHDVWHGTSIIWTEEDMVRLFDQEGDPRPKPLTAEEEQQIIDAICEALGIGPDGKPRRVPVLPELPLAFRAINAALDDLFSGHGGAQADEAYSLFDRLREVFGIGAADMYPEEAAEDNAEDA